MVKKRGKNSYSSKWAGRLATVLGEPAKQWKRGYSARTLAHCWHDADGFPKEVHAVLTAADPFRDIELLVAIPEHKVPLPPANAQRSQNDIWVLARCATGLVSIAVEGKVGEPFGETVSEWMATPTSVKKKRFEFLGSTLCIGSTLS